jgi:hypothetical protein
LPDPLVIQGEIWEEAWPTTVARLVTPAGIVLVAGDLITGNGSAGTGWDWRVYDLQGATPSTPIYSLNGQAASSVLAAIVLDGYWGGTDDVGYNFRHTLDMTQAGLVIEGGHVYRVCYRLNTTLYGPVMVVGRYAAKALLVT